MNNTGYLFVENSNTKITLLIPGWYRIHLAVELNSLDTGLHYYVRLLKDHITDEVFYHIDHNTLLPAEDIYYLESSMFVYSDGTNYIEVKGTVGSPTINGFGIGSSANNRFSIEFVST